MEKIFFGVNAITIIALLLAIIFTAGVVWRVEKKLDISYKFFLTAIILLLAAEILDLYYSIDNQIRIALMVKSLRMLFAVFFLVGVLFMRNIVRDLDGEE
ncbi:MAG: hypothetical protein P4L62_02910 [Candidatus Pacebacteria bacterium]|nr:hypothetical protein [Candidatus Paceibacterota bacterium]MDR3583284.1 hypothetical protein [Candidatus Paceibacterota bacterium]